MSFNFGSGYKGVNAIKDASGSRYTPGIFSDSQYLFINGNIIETANINNMSLSEYTSGYNALRVMELSSVFDYKIQGKNNTRIFPNLLSGGATITVNKNEASLDFQAPIGGRIVSQTKKYYEYQSGKLQQYLLTGVLENSGGVSGCITRFGSFDNNTDKTPISDEDRGGDGHFFELNGTTLYIVQRKSTDTNPYQSEIKVAQGSWNGDNLNGTGNSGFTLDVSKANIFIILRKWLGVGSVSLGVVVNGSIIIAHTFENNNTYGEVYMKRANLPIRYELDNTSGSATANCKQICCSYASIGGFNPQREIFTLNSGRISQGVSDEHYISIRLKAESNRHVINLKHFSYSAPSLGTTDSVLIKLYLNPTLNITGSWTSVNSDSVVEALTGTDATYTSGGTLIYQDVITRYKDIDLSLLNEKITLGSNIAGTQDIITIVIDEILGATVSSAIGILTWYENI